MRRILIEGKQSRNERSPPESVGAGENLLKTFLLRIFQVAVVLTIIATRYSERKKKLYLRDFPQNTSSLDRVPSSAMREMAPREKVLKIES